MRHLERRLLLEWVSFRLSQCSDARHCSPRHNLPRCTRSRCLFWCNQLCFNAVFAPAIWHVYGCGFMTTLTLNDILQGTGGELEVSVAGLRLPGSVSRRLLSIRALPVVARFLWPYRESE